MKAHDAACKVTVAKPAQQLPMAADVERLIDAGWNERSLAQLNYRAGCRDRTLGARILNWRWRSTTCATAATSRPSWSPEA